MRLKRPIILSIGFVAALFGLLVFQNCSKSGFNSGSLTLAQLSGQFDSSSNSGNIASLAINPTAPYDLLSESGLQNVQENLSLLNFKEYVPQYPLYSDGAGKRRWIYLPSDKKINTANLDAWVYPKGTITWKEFSVDGKKIETRVWEKTGEGSGPGAWRPSVYVWKSDQSDAVHYTGDFYSQPVETQMQFEAYNVMNKYRVFNANSCVNCHSSAVDVVNGFNYLQLSDTQAKLNIFNLENLFSNPPVAIDEIKGSTVAKAAIGYIQSNCATCHNGIIQARNFKHVSSAASYADENIVKELSKASTSMPLVTFGDTANSRIYVRQQNRQMPPTNIIIADPVGEKVLSDWINFEPR